MSSVLDYDFANWELNVTVRCDCGNEFTDIIFQDLEPIVRCPNCGKDIVLDVGVMEADVTVYRNE